MNFTLSIAVSTPVIITFVSIALIAILFWCIFVITN